MPHYECVVEPNDTIYVGEDWDKDGDLAFVIEHGTKSATIGLNKSDAKKLAEHILHLLEESK